MNFLFKNAAPVTASDTANIPTPSAANGLGNRGCFLYIGASLANIKVTTSGGQDITILLPAVGQVLPISVVKVFLTGTVDITGNKVIALWN